MDLAIADWDAALTWMPAPDSVTVDGGRLIAVAGAHTDMFVDPGTDETPLHTAPRALAQPPDGDFQFSARVKVDFRASYDAGVLLLWSDERTWAKLCFERTPQGEPSVVSVVTRGVSDDANGWLVAGNEIWLRISRLGPAWAFHASLDGKLWQMVRYFRLPADQAVSLGLEVQSPVGEGCTVEFNDLTMIRSRLADLRDGR